MTGSYLTVPVNDNPLTGTVKGLANLMMHGVTISFLIHHMQTDDSLPKLTSVFVNHKHRIIIMQCVS